MVHKQEEAEPEPDLLPWDEDYPEELSGDEIVNHGQPFGIDKNGLTVYFHTQRVEILLRVTRFKKNKFFRGRQKKSLGPLL